MKVFLISAAVLALAVPLAACDDNDLPQTPQEESAVMPQETMPGNTAPEIVGGDMAVNPAAGSTTVPANPSLDLPEVADIQVEPPLGEGSPDVPDTADEAVLPQDIADENIPPPPSREEFTDASCDYDAWIGTRLNEDTVKAEGRPFRILKPGDAMTMDHNPDRINVEHEDGNVTRVWCG